eukprot:1161622-Pelagomonas_calceolata.AAC.13
MESKRVQEEVKPVEALTELHASTQATQRLAQPSPSKCAPAAVAGAATAAGDWKPSDFRWCYPSPPLGGGSGAEAYSSPHHDHF